MRDVEKASALFRSGGFTCVLCKGETVYTSRETGISPMLDFIGNDTDLNGFSAADRIVGKAAAMLFGLAGISEVYADVMSQSAAAFLTEKGIPFSYGTLTNRIINRKGDGVCPMEQTVADISDVNEAYIAIRNKREALRKGMR